MITQFHVLNLKKEWLQAFLNFRFQKMKKAAKDHLIGGWAFGYIKERHLGVWRWVGVYV